MKLFEISVGKSTPFTAVANRIKQIFGIRSLSIVTIAYLKDQDKSKIYIIAYLGEMPQSEIDIVELFIRRKIVAEFKAVGYTAEISNPTLIQDPKNHSKDHLTMTGLLDTPSSTMTA